MLTINAMMLAVTSIPEGMNFFVLAKRIRNVTESKALTVAANA